MLSEEQLKKIEEARIIGGYANMIFSKREEIFEKEFKIKELEEEVERNNKEIESCLDIYNAGDLDKMEATLASKRIWNSIFFIK